MASTLYYIEILGSWRSMRPAVWKDFAESMAAHLQQNIDPPFFEDFGKPVYGRPSRVRVAEGPGGKNIYWSDDKHILIRAPFNWRFEDWKFAAFEACQHCTADEVTESADIFSLILQG